MDSLSSLTIAARFAGPPSSGNGGYTAGRLAACVTGDGPVSVTLRKPPPLDTRLRLETARGTAALLRGDQLVAEAATSGFSRLPPPPVDLEQALAAEPSYAGLVDHPFPTCFVCGPARTGGDGMRLAPGPSDPGRTACVWTPDASLSSVDDPTFVAGEFVWSALDCPGGWTSDLQSRPLVLGKMTASYDRRPRIGQACVVVGALHGIEGRKTFTSTALYEPSGDLLARAEQVWIAIDPASF